MKYKLKYHLKSGKIFEDCDIFNTTQLESVASAINGGRFKVDLHETNFLFIPSENVDFIEVEVINE